jgi:hypothetical protein
MELDQYRASDTERERIVDLMKLIPSGISSAIDIGARDGFISKKLAGKGLQVTALDLEKPDISGENIRCVKGDLTNLTFSDGAFDLVLCTEVIEHIPPDLLQKACNELKRVSTKYLIVGVPFRQDIRVGRCTCAKCGAFNPPWGHVNSFDLGKLTSLLHGFEIVKVSYVGTAAKGTNWLATVLMDLAGNPYGTYIQDEPCVNCGAALVLPPPRSFVQKVLTKTSIWLTRAHQSFMRTHPNWIHLVLEKRS